MKTLVLELSDAVFDRLREIAEREGVRVKDLARISIEEWLLHPREDFETIARDVLAKNSELYRRLA
jgi:hypothetical protein